MGAEGDDPQRPVLRLERGLGEEREGGGTGEEKVLRESAHGGSFGSRILAQAPCGIPHPATEEAS